MDGGFGKERVLVVDDEPQILVALQDVLGDEFTVLTSSTPERAIETVEHDPEIAVIITDQRMPHMTGDELLNRLSNMQAVGIMVSGFADLPAVIRAINEGKVFAYVTKPWDAEDLRFKVSKGVERFRLARQVAYERQLLSDLMNNSPDGIYFKDTELRFKRVNSSFAKSLGQTSTESLIGRKIEPELLTAELADAIETEERELLRSGEPRVDVVREYPSSTGSGEWYSESKAPIRDPHGGIDGLVAISRNVTERLKTLQALSQSEERLRHQTRILNSVLDGIGEGVLVVNANGHTLLFNSEAERVLGVRPRDVRLEDWPQAHGLCLPDGHTPLPPIENPLLRAVRGANRVELEAVVKRDKSERRVAIMATPLRNDTGEVTGAIGLLRDVTERRNLEQLLAHSQKMEAVGQLAGGIAHDFNNLLAVIEGGGELALGELEGHVAYEDVSDMVTAAKRAASLTRQLLAFSRRETAHPEPLDLADVVSGVEKMLRRLIGEHISFTTRLQQAKPVMADRGQLEQVLINLCVNARDAMPDGGTISVGLSARTLSEHDGMPGTEAVALTVSDTGMGIEPELHDRIFEPFFTTKEVGKGTGLGLAMVYGIVTQNGGRISLESTPGRGTTFTIVFPVTDQELQSVRPPGLLAGNTGGATILLVEDAPSVRHITARVLRRQGYVVLEASKPSEARAVVERGEAVDLLLVDLVMPEMNGAKLADELTKRNPNLKVLFMTGYADLSIQQAHSEALSQRERIIQKPFTSDALVDRVRATLATRTTPEG